MSKFDKEYHEYLKGNCKNYSQSLICALEEIEKGSDEEVLMKTYYLVEKNGYRTAVKGLAVLVHSEFKTFYRAENDVYVVRCQRTGFEFARGLTVKGARENARAYIKAVGVEEIEKEIKVLIKKHGIPEVTQ